MAEKKDWTDKMKNKTGAAAQFLQPYAENAEDNDKDEDIITPNPNVIHDSDEDPDYLDRMLKQGNKKKDELILHGIYLEPELSKMLNRLAKQGGRGAKSAITNDAFRKYFRDKGLLK